MKIQILNNEVQNIKAIEENLREKEKRDIWNLVQWSIDRNHGKINRGNIYTKWRSSFIKGWHRQPSQLEIDKFWGLVYFAVGQSRCSKRKFKSVEEQRLSAPKGFYRTKAWKMTRQLVLNRDGFACVKCGGTETLQVHHINYTIKGHGLDNLETLCKECHKKQHKINSKYMK